MKSIIQLVKEARAVQKDSKVLFCREASPLSTTTFVACGKPLSTTTFVACGKIATVFILSERGAKVYPMCPGCGVHNVRNRGAVLVGDVDEV